MHLQTFLTSSRPPEDVLRSMAVLLRESSEPMRPAELGERTGASRARRTRALTLLEQAGAVRPASKGQVRWVSPRVSVEAAVAEAVDIAERHQRLIRSRVEMMRAYAETTGCRRQLLLGYFGEQLDEPCGSCDTCEQGTARAQHEDGPFRTSADVRHAQFGHGVVMSVEDDRLTVLFDEVGYKTLALASAGPKGRGVLALERDEGAVAH